MNKMIDKKITIKALIYGILASLFFSFTFIFNRKMNVENGYWLWSAVLRYVFTLPILWVILRKQNAVQPVYKAIRKKTAEWLIWSTVGFGLFYAPLSMSSVYGESWFTAAMWQITIVAGVLLAPLFKEKIPIKKLVFSIIILSGIFLLQFSHIKEIQLHNSWIAFILTIIAGFSYPLGNRKMLQHSQNNITTIQRVYGMTLCSMPFWGLCSVIAFIRHGLPGEGQIIQSFIVALFSGTIATLLFFEATNLVKKSQAQLALIEATQAGEVVFTLLGGIIFLQDSMPAKSGIVGILIIIVGMVANSLN